MGTNNLIADYADYTDNIRHNKYEIRSAKSAFVVTSADKSETNPNVRNTKFKIGKSVVDIKGPNTGANEE